MADDSPPTPTSPVSPKNWVARRIKHGWDVFVRLRTLRNQIDDLDERLDLAVKARDEALEILGQGLLVRDELSGLSRTFAQTAAELAEDCVRVESRVQVVAKERENAVAERDRILGELDDAVTAARRNHGNTKTQLREVEEELSRISSTGKDEVRSPSAAEEAANERKAHLVLALERLGGALEHLEERRQNRQSGFTTRLEDLDAHAQELSNSLTHLTNRRRATLMDMGREALSSNPEALEPLHRQTALETLESVRTLRGERDQWVTARAGLDLGPLWRLTGVAVLLLVAIGLVWSALV